MITTTEMTAKIEEIRTKNYASAVENEERLFPKYDEALEKELLNTGIRGKAHTEITFAVDPIDDRLGVWCEIKKIDNDRHYYDQHHYFPVLISDYIKRLRDAGYTVSCCTSTLEIFSQSGKTSYGKRDFRTVYISF